MSTPVIWLLIAAAFALGEILTESFFLAPLASAALVMAVGTLLGAGVLLLVLFALAAGIVTLLVLRPLLRRERLDFAVGGAEHDFVVGQMGVVEEHVVNDESTGVIEIDGEVWTARARDDGQTFAPGDAVEVVAVRGAVALVDAPEKPRSADVRA
ncbi:MAG: NfeD family protein [Actinomycetes bacterium]|jgi:membrane protein implicated in regulation of membrane protease activity